MVSVNVKHHIYLLTQNIRVRGQELCESRGGRPGLLVPNKPHGFCGRTATLNSNFKMSFDPNMSARYLKTLSLIRIRTKRELPVRVQCYFTSTETIRLIRDGEPRAATSTFTQLLSSEELPRG